MSKIKLPNCKKCGGKIGQDGIARCLKCDFYYCADCQGEHEGTPEKMHYINGKRTKTCGFIRQQLMRTPM